MRDPKSAAVSPEADEARNELFLKRPSKKKKAAKNSRASALRKRGQARKRRPPKNSGTESDGRRVGPEQVTTI
jgi:hypothetical protein